MKLKRLLTLVLILAGVTGGANWSLAKKPVAADLLSGQETVENTIAESNLNLTSDWRHNDGEMQWDKFSPEKERRLLSLLELIEQDDQVKHVDIGAQSNVQRKIRAARKLRLYVDPRAVAALEILIEDDACEDQGEGEVFCVRSVAQKSLQEIFATPSLRKLINSSPLEEQIKIIRLYGTRPLINDFAFKAVFQYMLKHVADTPEIFVPLLVELFPGRAQVEKIARQYPEQTNIGLERCFAENDLSQVWLCINLARYLGKVQFIDVIHGIAFEMKGSVDYSNDNEIEELKTIAIGFYRVFEKDALKYYRAVLYGDYEKGKEYVVSGIKNLDNPRLLALLKEYLAYSENHALPQPQIFTNRLKKKIELMELAQR